MKHFPPRILSICFLSVIAALPVLAQQERVISGSTNLFVQISVVPPEGSGVWSAEEILSGGAVSVDINEEGVFDEENGKVKWGPFLDDGPRTLSYHLTGPAGEVTIEGNISFDGSNEPVDTIDVVVLPAPQSNFNGWRYLTLSGYLLQTLAAHPLSDMNLNGFTLFQEYAFGLSVAEFIDVPVIIKIPGSSGNAPNCDLSYYRNRFAVDLEFTIQQLDSANGWIPVDFENMGITSQELVLGTTDQVTEVVYPTIPLAAIEGSLMRVRARLLEP